MEGPLVSVSMGVMEPLLSKLTNLLEEEYDKLRGVSKQIKFLRDELRAMSPALEMLGNTQELSPLTRNWRDELRELAYDMEDCVDNFTARFNQEEAAGGPTGLLGLYHKLRNLVTRHEIADEIEQLKNRVMEVSERHKRYNFAESASNSSTSAVDPRLPALYEEIDRLVGIDGPKRHTIKLLALEMNTPSAKLPRVVSIAGCGGLGKTTLAKQVYDSIRSQFSCAVFMSVSRSPDVRRILRCMAQGFGFSGNTRDDDEQQLIDKLMEYLQDKRYLAVLDDVWDVESWKIIKLALPENDLGSRIITTTRNTTIALSFSSQGGNVYQMEPLSFIDSKRLLFRRAFGSENLSCSHLGSVPGDILRKCDGLPLAIITISSILTDQHAKCEWDRVLQDIGSALAKNPGAEKMTAILSMSYFDIPHHLRTCLLYLSLFPEDYDIEKQRLINRWIAEGFIHEEEGRTKYEIGEGYFNELINRSMIQPVDVMYGQAKACRVHDIIRDYIKCKAAEENFMTSLDTTEHRYTQEYKVRRLSVINGNEEHVTLWASQILSQVRSVTVFGRPVQDTLLPSTALRVLDLGDCTSMNGHHLSSIEKLFHLKYLCLCSHSITELPEKIGDLQYLQTLDVRGTSIKELPSTITNLCRLSYLYVDWVTIFPDGIVGQLHNLEDLRQYGVHSYEKAKSLKELRNLTKLKTLDIRWKFNWSNGSEGIWQGEGISYLGTVLSSCNLHNLSISDISGGKYPLSLDSWNPATPCSLRKLCIEDYFIYKVPKWMGSLGNLEMLKLDIIRVSPEDVKILGTIPSLRFLYLATCSGTNGRIIVKGSNGFRSLKYFSLYFWAYGTALKFKAGSMPKLEHIKLRFCVREPEHLNVASNLGIQHLSALSNVEVGIICNFDEDNRPIINNDSLYRRVTSDINADIEVLPNRPIVNLWSVTYDENHSECSLRSRQQMRNVGTRQVRPDTSTIDEYI